MDDPTSTAEANKLALDKPKIDVLLPFVQYKINQRRHSWRLTTMAFEDASQLLLIRVWQQYSSFDPEKGPFENWLSVVIKNRMTNILRDNLYRYVKPCIRNGGCVYNSGGKHCSYTKSGEQCSECPLYATWKKRKESEYNVKSSLTLENHTQEVNSMQSDFIDIEGKKAVIDSMMKERLSVWNRKVYKLLYIDNLTPAQASVKLREMAKKRKRKLREDDPVEYQLVLRASRLFKEMMIDIIRTEDL